MGGIGASLKKIFSKKKGELKKGWDFKADSEILGGTVIADIDNDGVREIIFGTKKGELLCLGQSGTPKWSFNLQENIDEKELLFYDTDTMNSISSTPAIANFGKEGLHVIVGSELGVIYCIDSVGKLVWKFKAGDSVRGGVVTGNITGKGENIIFCCTDGYLYVLNSQGKLDWKIKSKSGMESTPCICNETRQILFGTDDGTFYSVDFSGKLLWGYKTGEKITAKAVVAPIIGGETQYVLVGSYDGYLYAFELNGNLKWKFAAKGPIVSAVTVADVNQDKKLEIFFGSCDNKIYSLNYQGDKLWEYETNFWVVSSPIVADVDNDGRMEVIVGSYDTTLYILDAKGSYELEFVPGLSGVVHQAGQYSDVLTQEPGKLQGKKLQEFHTQGVVVGVSYEELRNTIIVSDKVGEIKTIRYIEEISK